MNAGVPALFFDRDGVINESPGDGYILDWRDFFFRPKIADSMSVAQRLGYRVFVITNQRCVGKGLLSQQQLGVIHDNMLAALHKSGITITKLYAYTGLEPDGYGSKPRPDFLHEAARDFSLDLSRSWMVGDQDKDMITARAASLRGVIRVYSGKKGSEKADFDVSSDQLPALLERVLAT